MDIGGFGGFGSVNVVGNDFVLMGVKDGCGKVSVIVSWLGINGWTSLTISVAGVSVFKGESVCSSANMSR